MTAPILEMNGVTKSFPTPAGRVDVLRGVDVSVFPGEFVMISGPSGSGKSTFLNVAALLDSPSGGTLLFEGADFSRMDEADLCRRRKERVGMVFQKYCLLPHRTAYENVLFRFRYLARDPADAKRLARGALDALGLASVADTPARLLSGGEMQRVAIARAIAFPPALLAADEPTGNLDAAAARTVMECLRKLNRDGMTVLMVTHNESLLEYGTRRVQCRNGRIEA
jgi:ABC-type lipoprotein export system ATPase subunit